MKSNSDEEGNLPAHRIASTPTGNLRPETQRPSILAERSRTPRLIASIRRCGAVNGESPAAPGPDSSEAGAGYVPRHADETAYSGMRSFCPGLMRSGLLRMSRFASKIFMYLLPLP